MLGLVAVYRWCADFYAMEDVKVLLFKAKHTLGAAVAKQTCTQ